MIKSIKTALVIAITTILTAGSLSAQSQDIKIFESYISYMKNMGEKPIEKIVVESAKFFLSVPYVAHTLETEPESLIINLREMDCTTFVETILALSRTIKSGDHTLDNFKRELTLIRYRDGVITGYQDRLHYTSDWFYENERKGLIQMVADNTKFEPLELNLNIISTNPQKYKQLANNPALVDYFNKKEKEIGLRSYLYLPTNKIEQNRSLLKSGDIVGFTTKIEGLDVSHVGIVFNEGGRATFIHASSTSKKVIVNREPIWVYAAKSSNTTGIIVARPIYSKE